jgi:tRNA threonylcarbamoyladenosine biosynthesis protein TsaB
VDNVNPYILAIETSTDICSVALLRGRQVCIEIHLDRPRAHAEQLVPMIRDVLASQREHKVSIAAVAVSGGPGSYTGLRIGSSTAKGFCLGTGARLIAVPSLQGLAARVVPVLKENDVVATFFNSRRDEVYGAAYRVLADRPEVALEAEALAYDEVASWLAQLPDRPVLAGEGAPGVARLIDGAHPVLDPRVYRPGAAAIGLLAMDRFERNLFEDLTTFEPAYLKEFVAKKAARSIFERMREAGVGTGKVENA